MADTTTLMIGDAVSAEVALFKATRDKARTVAFDRQTATADALPPRVAGARDAATAAIKDYVAENGELEVPRSGGGVEVRHGVETEAGFVDLTEQLEAIDDAVRIEGLRVEAFVDVRSVPRERAVGAYFVAARGRGSGKVLRLLRDAMRETNRAALVRWTKRTNQALGVVYPHRSGALLLTELVFAGAAREPDPSCVSPLEAADVSPSELASAVNLVRAYSERPVAIDEVEDERTILRARLREFAEEGHVADFAIPEDVGFLDADVEEAFAKAAAAS